MKDKFPARVIASLFVLTTLMGMVDAYVAAPILRGPLADISDNMNAVLTGGLMRLFMSVGVIGIALGFLPVVRRKNETVALAYLAFRAAECVLLSLGVCGHLFLISLSHRYTSADSPDDAAFLAMADGAAAFTRTTYQMAMTILGIASILLCTALLRTRLIPASIAALGLAGYTMLLASSILDLLGVIDTINGSGALLYIPGGLFELVVLPLWLWIRGFPSTAADRVTAGGTNAR